MARIKVTVERIDGYCNLPVQVGDHFFVDGSRLIVPPGGFVCIWALQSMMPIFPILGARDALDESHWIRKVRTFSCPDPQGLVQYRLEVVEESAGGDRPHGGDVRSGRPHVPGERPGETRPGNRARRGPGSDRDSSEPDGGEAGESHVPKAAGTPDAAGEPESGGGSAV